MIKIEYCTDPREAAALLRRRDEGSKDVSDVVSGILADVKRNGDKAILALTKRFDGAELEKLEVTQDELECALSLTDDAFIGTLNRAKENIHAFHLLQKQKGFAITDRPGIIMGQRVTPLDRVGIYVPGGTAPLISTVLMIAIPAKIAGVGEVVMTTPPGKDGKINPAVLTAAKLAGVDRVFKCGGAQAIAGLAYGTQSIPKVDKIVGPGSIYVATAKRMVFGEVGIDMIAGPSDILVIADETANAAHIAADLLSQSEHDILASAVLVTTSKALAEAVRGEVEKQLPSLPRREIAERAVKNNSMIIITDTLKRAAEISNEIAPEHLELCVAEPFALLGLIKHAGSIFLGHYTPEALGDYLAGPNHTLPTNGTARFSSPLSVDD
ncbi:MAG: histidinol dehydrogenase, partial [Oscillospiraceae bacterium]|nr:histidinol dehydrogenase [Oscillospiraceae bacterium]